MCSRSRRKWRRCARQFFVEEPPSAAALEPKHPEQQRLVGRSLLFNWRAIGWCLGVVERANGDRRFKMAGDIVNFYVYYEINGDTSAHALKIDNYGTDHEPRWLVGVAGGGGGLGGKRRR